MFKLASPDNFQNEVILFNTYIAFVIISQEIRLHKLVPCLFNMFIWIYNIQTYVGRKPSSNIILTKW